MQTEHLAGIGYIRTPGGKFYYSVLHLPMFQVESLKYWGFFVSMCAYVCVYIGISLHTSNKVYNWNKIGNSEASELYEV